MSDFWEAYKDPRWQRKRLEVMQAAGFACMKCGAEDRTLNVHHKRYVRGRKPWEYDPNELHCLCEACHKSHHDLMDELNRWLAKLEEPGLSLPFIIGYIKGHYLQWGGGVDQVERLQFTSNDPHCESIGICEAYRIHSSAGMDSVLSQFINGNGMSHADLMKLKESEQGS